MIGLELGYILTYYTVMLFFTVVIGMLLLISMATIGKNVVNTSKIIKADWSNKSLLGEHIQSRMDKRGNVVELRFATLDIIFRSIQSLTSLIREDFMDTVGDRFSQNEKDSSSILVSVRKILEYLGEVYKQTTVMVENQKEIMSKEDMVRELILNREHISKTSERSSERVLKKIDLAVNDVVSHSINHTNLLIESNNQIIEHVLTEKLARQLHMQTQETLRELKESNAEQVEKLELIRKALEDKRQMNIPMPYSEAVKVANFISKRVRSSRLIDDSDKDYYKNSDLKEGDIINF